MYFAHKDSINTIKNIEYTLEDKTLVACDVACVLLQTSLCFQKSHAAELMVSLINFLYLGLNTVKVSFSYNMKLKKW